MRLAAKLTCLTVTQLNQSMGFLCRHTVPDKNSIFQFRPLWKTRTACSMYMASFWTFDLNGSEQNLGVKGWIKLQVCFVCNDACIYTEDYREIDFHFASSSPCFKRAGEFCTQERWVSHFEWGKKNRNDGQVLIFLPKHSRKNPGR